MSMRPGSWPEPAPEVVAAVRAMYRGRRRVVPLAVAVRDQLGEVFADGQFAQAFGVRGRPGWSPGRLALVTVLQMAEDLTDRQAAEAVRLRLDWKYALGLSLDDAGFDASVLSEFRARVVEHGLEQRVLDLLLAAVAAKGLVEPGGKQRTDSTHVVARVRDLNRVELAGESVRACLEALAAADPQWLSGAVDVAGWSRRYGARVESWRLPAGKARQAALAVDYGRDGFALLQAVYGADAPGWLAELPAVDVLRVVLLQNYTRTVDERGREVVRRREADTDGLPPGRWRLTSPYDLDARWGVKRGAFWNGYKLHVTETCDTPPSETAAAGQPAGVGEPPNLITNVVTTPATTADSAVTEPVHQQLAGRGLLPAEHYVDSGYTSARHIVEAATTFGVSLVTPVLADVSAQARAGAGFDRSAFAIDFDRQQATCPQGQTSKSWTPVGQADAQAAVITFPVAACRVCPVRVDCTTATTHGRKLTVRSRQVHHAQQQARAQQNTTDWQANYARRAGVEGTIRQAIAVTGIRQARYRGLPKTHLEHIYSATALNLIRLHAYWNGHPLDRHRTSHLTRLQHRLTPAA